MARPQSSTGFSPARYHHQLKGIFKALEQQKKPWSNKLLTGVLKQYPKDGAGYFSKAQLIAGYREMAGKDGLKEFDKDFEAALKMKPVRTISGVTPVTVLTKPFPCPGKCIFCPSDIRMPKSYLPDEPGAQRAEKNHFDPYLQAYSRLEAFKAMGHDIQKVELLVLGGTWSFYPLPYKLWFISRLFQALNDFGEEKDNRSKSLPSITTEGLKKDPIGGSYNQRVTKAYLKQELEKREQKREVAEFSDLYREQKRNETAKVRCVGLVLETRPDYIDEEEVVLLRRLGCTKTQIGLQSLDDMVLEMNSRGHDVAASRRALALLRQAGFKIHAHIMPNLYGSTVKKDKTGYRQLFRDPDFKPDELKIYPCSLIDGTGLMEKFQKGEWRPYSYEELLEVLTDAMDNTPVYCRLTRVVRDIPGTDIVAGNKLTNFRQIAEKKLQEQGLKPKDIRGREIKNVTVSKDRLQLKFHAYRTSVSTEYFLEWATEENQIAGFLRLSLPLRKPFIDELSGCAIIREVHVYGSALGIGKRDKGAAQHLGLGAKLIKEAEKLSLLAGFSKLAVISAVGTREYYRKQGFLDGELYQIKPIVNDE